MEGVARGDGECVCGRVNHVSCSVFKHEACVYHWVACLRAFGYDFVEGFADCGDELRRDVGPHHFADELIPSLIAVRVDRLNIANHARILTSASSLLFVQKIIILFLQNSLTVVNARLPSFALDSELPLDPF